MSHITAQLDSGTVVHLSNGRHQWKAVGRARIASLRAHGLGWKKIAAEVGLGGRDCPSSGKCLQQQLPGSYSSIMRIPLQVGHFPLPPHIGQSSCPFFLPDP